MCKSAKKINRVGIERGLKNLDAPKPVCKALGKLIILTEISAKR